jgi:hypothetical protein
MRIKKLVLGGAALLSGMAVSNHAIATDLSYNYVEANYYIDVKAKGVGVTVGGDGFGIGGSVEIAPNILLLGEVAQFALDNSRNIDYFLVGGGYVMRMSPQIDLVASAQLGREKVSGFSGDTGYRVGFGVRAVIDPQIEAFGRFAFENFDGSGSFVEGGAMYSFSDQFSLGGKARFGGGLRTISLQGRFTF